MKTFANKKAHIIGIIAIIILFATGIFAFGGSTTTVYAQEGEIIRDGYTIEDIQVLLNSTNSLETTDNSLETTEFISVYSQDGTMIDIEVDIEEENSSSSLVQPMAAPSFDVQTLVNSGRPDSQSIVITIMGDGFTSSQQSTFITAATNSANSLIGQYPMNLFKDYFNIYAVEVISEESGVSRDIDEIDYSWWWNNPSVDNYFGSRFYADSGMFSNGTERNLQITNKARARELARPYNVLSIIICNSIRWGGTGGEFAVSSRTVGYENIAAHEFGHAFGNLGDEYWYTGESFNASERANKSKSTTKWSEWIDTSDTGIYKIGTYRISSNSSDEAYSWYKPSEDCKMEHSTSDFCAVCSAELIRLMELKVGSIFSTTNLSGNNIRLDSMNLNYQGHFTIPNKINGRIVTELGAAFFNKTGITQVTIPNRITIIGANAFTGCTQLSQISIPESVTSIGGAAFDNCTGLTNLTLPNNLTSIGDYAFRGCTSLGSITIPDGVTQINQNTFENCTNLTNITLSNNLTSIGDYAFRGCTKLTSITLPNNLTSIGYSAFIGCKKLSSITIPDGVTQINPETFYNCTELKYITLSNNLTRIGYSAFKGCKSLGSITIPDSVKYMYSNTFENCTSLTNITLSNNLTSIGYSAFKGCESLGIITIPDSVTHIDSYAFEDCTNLTNITLSDNLIVIGSSAFKGCTSLSSITIPNSVTSIEQYAFNGCSELISITIPFVGRSKTATGHNAKFGYIFGKTPYNEEIGTNQNGITNYIPTNLKTVEITSGTNIAQDAFYNCSNLTSITIPNTVTNIGSNAFYGCTDLASVTIPNSVSSIEQSAFNGCTGLISITIPFVGRSKTETGDDAKFGYIFGTTSYNEEIGTNQNGITYYIPTNLKTVEITSGTNIAQDAFYNCSNLTSITIPNTVTNIGSNAFYDCISLTDMYIPNSVTSIGGYAFNGCSNLENVTFASGSILGTIQQSTFENCIKLKNINIPISVTSIEQSAFSGCAKLNYIVIQNNVTSIGDEAFSFCTGLTHIFLGNGLSNIGDYAFAECGSLKNITIPNSVTNIGKGAFFTSGLTNITIPNSVTSIGNEAFAGCSSLENVTFESGSILGTIQENTFRDCISLTNITIPNSVTSIGSNVFNGCSELTSITIPFVGSSKTATGDDAKFGFIFGESSYTGGTATYQNDITYYIPTYLNEVIITGGTNIAQDAFYNCSNLTSITIPNTVTSIGSNAFYSCTDLTNITIPSSVTSIGINAFSGCTSLTSIDYNVVVTKSGYFNFMIDDINSLTVKINGVTTTFSNNSKTNYLTFGNHTIRVESVNIATKVSFPIITSVEQIWIGSNKNILSNIQNGKNILMFNNFGSRFLKFTLTSSEYNYPEGAIIIRDANGNIIEKYVGTGFETTASSLFNANTMIAYLPASGIFYIEINYIDTSCTTLYFNINFIDSVTINLFDLNEDLNYPNILDFTNATNGDNIKTVNLMQSGRFVFEVFNIEPEINSNVIFIIIKETKNSYNQIVLEILEMSTINDYLYNEYFDLSEGKYYIGYLNAVGIQLTYLFMHRQVTNSGSQWLTPDPEFHVSGSEVNLNGGTIGGNTITEGFTRLIYLANNHSRLDYDWFSSNTNAAIITNYGTVLALPVSQDTTIRIMAVNKYDPSIVFIKEFIIIKETNTTPLTIELTMTVSANTVTSIDLSNTIVPINWLQYYNWIPNNHNYLNVDTYGMMYINSTGIGQTVIVTGYYIYNPRVQIVITVNII